MFEATTDSRTRDAMQRAHEVRGEVFKDAWAWLFPAARQT